MTRVLIVDDQPSFRHHLRQLLVTAGLTVVGEAGDMNEATASCEQLRPDLAIIDVMLPGINGIEGARRLKSRYPSLRVILISIQRDHSHLLEKAAAKVGAEAFISKDDLDLSLVKSWFR